MSINRGNVIYMDEQSKGVIFNKNLQGTQPVKGFSILKSQCTEEQNILGNL